MKFIIFILLTYIAEISFANTPIGSGIYISTTDQKCRLIVLATDIENGISMLQTKGSGTCLGSDVFICESDTCLSFNSDEPKILLIIGVDTFLINKQNVSTVFVKN